MSDNQESFRQTPDDVWKEFLRLTQGKRGIYIGEWHGIPHAVDFIVGHLAELKKLGFNKVYIELDHYAVKALKGGPLCFMDLRKAHGAANGIFSTDMFTLPVYASPHKIEVLGHNDLSNLARKIEENGVSPASMDRRNNYAADYIKKTLQPDDRYIVIGGSDHSGKEGGIIDGKPIKGLDELLDIPSMDFRYLSIEEPTWYSAYVEAAKNKINRWLGRETDRGLIDIKPGGEAATTIVTATKLFSFDKDISLSKDQIKSALEAARAAGDCSYQKGLGEREILNISDVINDFSGQVPKTNSAAQRQI